MISLRTASIMALLIALSLSIGIKAVPASNNGGGATPVVPPNCGSSAAWSTQPIINVRWIVTNDEDSGVQSYWALDNYQRGLIVWQSLANPTSFCTMSQYNGSWQTFSGALSPQNGVTQTSDGSGQITGGRAATFTAILKTTPDKPTHGFIGTFDYGGTKSDILKNSYATQTGGTPVHWECFYFMCPPGLTAYTEPTWGWVYIFQDGIGYGNMWANYASGNFGDIVITQVCGEGDGNGDFHGDNGNGHFTMDNDGCKDGDNNNVQMSDRGDGKSFQSNSINTANFDSLTHTLTITGLGVTNGVPVAFTFVTVETGPTTPGWVSFTSSDGYTNAGTLTSGNITLH